MNPSRPLAPVLRSAAGLVADVFVRDGGTGVAVIVDGEAFCSFICRRTQWYTDAALSVGGDSLGVVRVYWGKEFEPMLLAGPARRLEAVARALSQFVDNHRRAEADARRLRYEHAIARCGELLLRPGVADESIGLVLHSLRTAAGVARAFAYEHVSGVAGPPQTRLRYYDCACSPSPDECRPGSLSTERSGLPDAALPGVKSPVPSGTGLALGKEPQLPHEPPKDALVRPITTGDTVWGLLGIGDTAEREWTEDEVYLVRSVATMLGHFLLSISPRNPAAAPQR